MVALLWISTRVLIRGSVRSLFAAVLMVGLKQFHRLSIGAGSDADKVCRHCRCVSILVVALGKEFFIAETIC